MAGSDREAIPMSATQKKRASASVRFMTGRGSSCFLIHGMLAPRSFSRVWASRRWLGRALPLPIASAGEMAG